MKKFILCFRIYYLPWYATRSRFSFWVSNSFICFSVSAHFLASWSWTASTSAFAPLKLEHKWGIEVKRKRIKLLLLWVHLNILSKTSVFFIDGTFKIVPKEFYQLLIIQCWFDLTSEVIPYVFVLLTSKSLSENSILLI